jgi:hypothetical protein
MKRRIMDINEIAYSVITDITKPEKNPAAVELGRLGGLKGGYARARKLTVKKRVAIAKKAANARWAKKKQNRHRK